MKIVGNYVTETDVAMELCKKVQVEEECVIHVEESTNFYTHLRFSLLASTWFPRPLGVCLWSALHVLLVLYEALMLLVLFPTVFVLVVLWDAFMVAVVIYMVFLIPVAILGALAGVGVAVALAWLWLLITCRCCTMPGRAPGQSLGQYLFAAGGLLQTQPQDPQPAPVVEGRAAAPDGPCAFLKESSMTPKFVNHVILVSFPYRRAQLGDLCREIVPRYDPIVIE